MDTFGLSGNRLRSLDLPSNLTALAFLNLRDNQLTNITCLPNIQKLIGLFVDGTRLRLLCYPNHWPPRTWRDGVGFAGTRSLRSYLPFGGPLALTPPDGGWSI